MARHFLILGLGMLLGLGCASPSADAATGNVADSAQTSISGQVPMNQQDPQGQWKASVAPDYPLSLTKSGEAYILKWDPTMDTDMSFEGLMTAKGANVYYGEVKFSSGDETGKHPMTLRFDPQVQTLSMEFTVLFERPQLFTRMNDKPGLRPCVDVAQSIVEASGAYKSLEADNEGLEIMDESELPGRYDFRVYVDGGGDEVQTLARYRVDIQKKQFFQYDPIEGDYIELEGMASLFVGAECK